MRKSKFIESQIAGILQEGEARCLPTLSAGIDDVIDPDASASFFDGRIR